MTNLPENQSNWNEVAQSVFREMQSWQKEHSKATFVEIEQAVDQRLAKLRNQMIADSSQSQAEGEEPNLAQCQSCGVRLSKRGKRTRRVVTQGGENIELEREYLVCPNCKVGLFPPR